MSELSIPRGGKQQTPLSRWLHFTEKIHTWQRQKYLHDNLFWTGWTCLNRIVKHSESMWLTPQSGDPVNTSIFEFSFIWLSSGIVGFCLQMKGVSEGISIYFIFYHRNSKSNVAIFICCWNCWLKICDQWKGRVSVARWTYYHFASTDVASKLRCWKSNFKIYIEKENFRAWDFQSYTPAIQSAPCSRLKWPCLLSFVVTQAFSAWCGSVEPAVQTAGSKHKTPWDWEPSLCADSVTGTASSGAAL